MNTPIEISKIITLETEESNEMLSILYLNKSGELVMSLYTDYGNAITVFSLLPNLVMLPFEKSRYSYPESGLERITCIVPEGRNFFEEDFSELNRHLNLKDNGDFQFSM